MLSVASCAKEQPTTNPPPPPATHTQNPPPPDLEPDVKPDVKPDDEADIPPPTNPPPPIEPQPEPQHLPTWDDVPSGHPEGATNPPIPVLVVTPDGECYKRWQSPFMGRQGVSFDPHVEDCKGTDIGCGTRIQCTAEAEALKAGKPVTETPK